MGALKNICDILLITLPIIFYCRLIYLFIPNKTITFKRAKGYLISGMISVVPVILLHIIFYDLFNLKPSVFQILNSMFEMFVLVALVEEAAKYLSFQYISNQLKLEYQKLEKTIEGPSSRRAASCGR